MRAVVSSPLLFLLLSLAATVCHGLDPSQCSSTSEGMALSSDYRQCPSSGDLGFFDVVKTKCVEACGKEGGSSCGESCVLQTIIASCEGREEQKKRALRRSCEQLMDGAAKATGGCEQFVEECVVAAEATSATRDAKATGQNLVQAPVKLADGPLKSVEDRSSGSERKVSDEMKRHPLFQRVKRAVDCNAIKDVKPTKKCDEHAFEFLGEVEVMCSKVCTEDGKPLDADCANLCFLKQMTDNCGQENEVKALAQKACETAAGQMGDPIKGQCDNWKSDCFSEFASIETSHKCNYGAIVAAPTLQCTLLHLETLELCRVACPGDNTDECKNKCFLASLDKKCLKLDRDLKKACSDAFKEFGNDIGKCSVLLNKCAKEFFDKSPLPYKCDFKQHMTLNYKAGTDIEAYLSRVKNACKEDPICFVHIVLNAKEDKVTYKACPGADKLFTDNNYNCDYFKDCYKEYHHKRTFTVKTAISTKTTTTVGSRGHSTRTTTTTTTAEPGKNQKSSGSDTKEPKKDEEDEESSRKKEVITILVWIGGTIIACCIFYAILHFCDQRDWCRRR